MTDTVLLYLKLSQFKHTIKHYSITSHDAQTTGRGARAVRWCKMRTSMKLKG